MEINARDDRKIVEVWLTRQERQDASLREKLKPMYRQYKNKSYLVAVFQSGEEDLYGQTSALLCTNRDRMARQEVERERQQRTEMVM